MLLITLPLVFVWRQSESAEALAARVPAEVNLGQQLSSPPALSLLRPLQLLIMREEILVGSVVEVNVAWNDEPWGFAQK